jgi:hypothetical protein
MTRVMTARALALVSLAFLAAVGGAAFGASCATESLPVGYTGPTGTPGLAISSPPNGACVEVTNDADAFVPIELSLTNFILRPPGGCIGLTNCGQARLTVNGLVNNLTASTIVDMSFDGPIASHYGTWKIEVELIDDQGNPWILPMDGGAGGAPVTDYGPYIAKETITTAASCEGGS